jgi:hypothetical protein
MHPHAAAREGGEVGKGRLRRDNHFSGVEAVTLGEEESARRERPLLKLIAIVPQCTPFISILRGRQQATQRFIQAFFCQNLAPFFMASSAGTW